MQLLEKGPQLSGDPDLARIYEQHLEETHEHERLVEQRLDARGGDTTGLKDAAMRAGALNWGMFFQLHPDTSGKLAAFAYAFEHLEIAGYEELKRVARKVGDEETIHMAEIILGSERAAAQKLYGAFDRAVDASLHEVGRRLEPRLEALPPRGGLGQDLLARRRLLVFRQLGQVGDVDVDGPFLDPGDALSGEVARLVERAGRDGQPVEDVLPAVAGHLVDRADLVSVRAEHLPAALDQQPGDWIAHTARPPRYQTGPCVPTGFVSERAQRICTEPVMPFSSRRWKQRLTICGEAP